MSGRVERAAVVALTVQAGVVGIWAGFWPRSFHAEFPGFGQQWLQPEGPYSEHLVRDLGTLSLPLAVLTAAAALARPRRGRTRVVAAAWLVYALPHLAYHVAHRSNLPPVDQALSIGALVVQVALPALLLLPRAGRGPDTRTRLTKVAARQHQGDCVGGERAAPWQAGDGATARSSAP
jgi:hypothetical protein